MSPAPQPRLSAVPVLAGLFGLLFVVTACSLLFLPGPHSPLPGLGAAGMGVVGVLAFKRIMARARDTELALEEAERYIEAVADLSQDIHAIIDAGTRTFLYLNPAASSLLGHPLEAFTKGGLAFFGTLVHPEDLAAVNGRFEELLAPQGQAPAAPGQEPVLEQTFRARDSQGGYRWFKMRLTVFARRVAGDPAELLAVIQDVTGQRPYVEQG
ncbi:MAG: PAS domain-containing protein [Holophaga sp.]|jgi:PAS domain S-box-containing protein